MADKQTILVVEDDPNVSQMLDEFLNVQGYHVVTTDAGEDAVRTCRANPPHLALLDIHLPDIDGYEVARRLLTHRRTKHIPLIFLTQRRERVDRLQGLGLGAVDYVTKPCDLNELQLRVRNALRSNAPPSPFNRITGLPEGKWVDEKLSELLTHNNWGVILASLRGLDYFRETYGFVAADDVLRALTLMLKETAQHAGAGDDFMGHLTQESFVLITSLERGQILGEKLKGRLEHSVDYFYPLKDRATSLESPYRLMLRVSVLTAPEKNFSDLDTLKTALLRTRSL